MRSVGLEVWRWVGWCAVLVVLIGLGESRASTYSTGTSNCSGCHGTAGTATPPRLPSQSSNILLGADLSDSCASNASCSLRTVILGNASMGAGVSGQFTNAELDAVRLYLLQVRNAEVTNTAPSFASTVVGQTTTDTFTVTIRNYRGSITGFSGAINYSFSTSGADYSIVSAPGGTCAATGSTTPTSCAVNVTVQFAPSAAGTRNGSLNVNVTPAIGTDPDPVNDSIALSATGIAAVPGFNITPSSRTFTAKVGQTATQSFTISNPGTAALDLTSFNFSSAVYTRSGSSTCSTAVNVAAGGNCTLTVTFAPVAAGTANATLTVNHNGASSPDSVDLFGTGTVPILSSNVATLDFQNSQVGVPRAAPAAITLTNTGSAALVFSATPFTVGGTHPADFSFSGTCAGATVAPGNTCTLNGTFTPAATGARSATLTINSDASNVLPAITLAGTGVALPEPVVTFPATDFPDTVIGGTAAQTRQVTISNDRTLDIGYSVANTTDFNVQSESCPTRVVPGGGGSCTVTWRFQPQLAGGETRRTANVTFNFTGTGGNPSPTSVVGGLAGRALLPLGAPTSLAPSAGFGLPTTVSTLLSNRSASALTLSALAISGTAAADYSLDATNGCPVGLALTSGSSCTLVVRFNPSTGGARNATLTITHDALGSPQAIALNGSATQGAIQLSTFALTFPSTALNASAAQSITVQNNGSQALNFSAFDLAGAAAGDYTRSGDCAVGTPLAIGVQCTLTITFAPTALGTRSASLTIQSDASNGPATVTLTGTGVPIPAPQVSLTPTGLDFGTQTVGNLYPARTIRLSNAGNADLHTASVAVEGTAFATSSTCPGTLAPGAGCDVQIVFTPLAANTDYTGTLRVVSDAPGSPHTAPLAGRGSVATLAALTWSPLVSELNFGTVSSGALSAPQTATLLNQGPGGVTLTVLNAVGADAAAFAVTGGTCAVGASLFEGQSCTVVVQFAPSTAGARQAQLQVASSGSFPPALALTGTGLGGPAPGAALSATTLDLGTVRAGAQSAPSEIVLSSTGSGALRVTAWSADAPFTVAAKSCPGVPFTLPAGSECTLTVSFAPNASGDLQGALTVTVDANPPTLQVALSGRGEPAADLSSGGGCSMASGDSATDPTLWTLVLLAALVLLARRRARRRP